MKTFFAFLVGLGAGALALYLYWIQPESTTEPAMTHPKIADPASAADYTAVADTPAMAANLSEAMSEKIRTWHLTHDDIKADLARTGQVVRDNATRAEEKIEDARIVAVIRAKYVLDRGRSVHAIEVESKDGNVTLTGSVASEVWVGTAVAHALETDGVHARLRA